jgi:predicted AAA+ superfamily ATPase
MKRGSAHWHPFAPCVQTIWKSSGSQDTWRLGEHAVSNTYALENEIRQENIVEDMGAFIRFLRLAALESGHQVNYTKIAKAVGVAVNTLRKYYQVLEDAYVGLRLPAFGRSRKRVLSSPRYLLFDIGVRHMLAELPINEALLTLDAGHIFEQWVPGELYYRCQYAGRGFRLSSWRNTSGAEVDGIIETPDEVIPVEVKWTDRPSPGDARHVETFIRHHQDMASRGYVICRTPHKQRLSDRVLALPWDVF